jgi:hypothetical protein
MKEQAIMSKIEIRDGRSASGTRSRFFYDADPPLADEAAAQCEARRTQLSDACRQRLDDREALEDGDDVTPQNAQAGAERAWQDRKERHASRRRSKTAQRQTCLHAHGDASR